MTMTQQLVEIGRAWGEQEVEAWRDQHGGSMSSAPDWIPGVYCGSIEEQAGLNTADRDCDDEAVRDAYDCAYSQAELIIDSAAQDVWDAAKAEEK